MNPAIFDRLRTAMTRRYFFGKSATGLGVAALASCLDPQLFAGNAPSPQQQTFGQDTAESLPAQDAYCADRDQGQRSGDEHRDGLPGLRGQGEHGELSLVSQLGHKEQGQGGDESGAKRR